MSINRFLRDSRRGCLFQPSRKQEVLPPGDMPVLWPVQGEGWVGEEQASGGFSCPAWGSSGCRQGGIVLISLFTLGLLILSSFACGMFSAVMPVLWIHLEKPLGSACHQHGETLVLPFPGMHIREGRDLVSVLFRAGSGSEILSA